MFKIFHSKRFYKVTFQTLVIIKRILELHFFYLSRSVAQKHELLSLVYNILFSNSYFPFPFFINNIFIFDYQPSKQKTLLCEIGRATLQTLTLIFLIPELKLFSQDMNLEFLRGIILILRTNVFDASGFQLRAIEIPVNSSKLRAIPHSCAQLCNCAQQF